jgi:hypothetical protein
MASEIAIWIGRAAGLATSAFCKPPSPYPSSVTASATPTASPTASASKQSKRQSEPSRF